VNRGYISVVFLAIFMTIISISNIFYFKINCNFHALNNLKEINNNLEAEIIILNKVKCQLRNKELDDWEITINGHNYFIEYQDDQFLINSDLTSYTITLIDYEINGYKIN